MAVELPSDLENKHEARMAIIEEYYEKEEFETIVPLLDEVWSAIPEPKESYSDSFHIADYIIHIALKLSDYEKATKWADIILICAPQRCGYGEREQIVGATAYESGDMKKALEYFKIANEKSDGRIFNGRDPKYLKFFSENNK